MTKERTSLSFFRQPNPLRNSKNPLIELIDNYCPVSINIADYPLKPLQFGEPTQECFSNELPHIFDNQRNRPKKLPLPLKFEDRLLRILGIKGDHLPDFELLKNISEAIEGEDGLVIERLNSVERKIPLIRTFQILEQILYTAGLGFFHDKMLSEE